MHVMYLQLSTSILLKLSSNCNTSAAIDIDSAQVKFEELLLTNIPGEDVSSLSTLALKYIKIMV